MIAQGTEEVMPKDQLAPYLANIQSEHIFPGDMKNMIKVEPVSKFKVKVTHLVTLEHDPTTLPF